MNKIQFVFIVVILIITVVLLCAACNSPIGFGETIDLEPPVLKVTCIVLPDGTEIPVDEENNKLSVGPGILVGTGFILKGEVYDNVLVEKILVEEIGANANMINGLYPKWDNAQISRKSSKGMQTWSIVLDGINKGERVLRITAYDAPKNIGQGNVKQLTLLVDTDPPIIESIKIERQPGLYVDLLPKAILEELDPQLFEHIDYFQNEKFLVRASISHDFSLAGVELNLVDEAGNELFTEGLQRTSGSLYTPVWEITENLLTAANSVYEAGRHYLNVLITARAEAGHSGQNSDTSADVSNLLYNFCWHPEADIPHIQVDNLTGGEIVAEKGSIFPLRVFDDDNAGEVYTAVVSENYWINLPGTDSEKMQALYDDTNRANFTVNGLYPLQENKISALARNAVIAIETGNDRGRYRLLVLARDKKETGSGVWANAIYTLNVTEEGIPVIIIESPLENTVPQLTNNSDFSVEGRILNIDKVSFLKLAWIPDGANLTSEEQLQKGKEALLTGTLNHGIQIWNIDPSQPAEQAEGKKYYEQSFSKTFNIFEDFMFNSDPENKVKFFILYTKGTSTGSEAFYSFRIMPYITEPEITTISPGDEPFGYGEDIEFKIKVISANGVPIESVELKSEKDDADIPLQRNGDLIMKYGKQVFRLPKIMTRQWFLVTGFNQEMKLKIIPVILQNVFLRAIYCKLQINRGRMVIFFRLQDCRQLPER